MPITDPNNPNSEANRLERLQSQGISNRATENLSNDLNPTIAAPIPEPPTTIVTGVDGQKFEQGAINPETGLTNPVPTPPPAVETPTISTEVPTPTPVKTDIKSATTPEVNYNVGLGAEDRISKNLETFKTQGMTADQIKQASGYATADANKKAQIDAFTAAMTTQATAPVDEVSIMNLLRTNSPITAQVRNSPAFNVAQQNWNKVKAFSTYSVNNLVGAMNNGSLLPGTKVYNELLNDPVMKQKLTDAQTFIAKNPVNIPGVTSTVSDEILANNPTLSTALSDGTLTQDEYAKLTNSPDVVAKAKDVETKTNKYNAMKAEYDDIENQVKAQFPGSPFADAIIADRQKAKYKNLVLAKGEADSALGTLTELKTQASSLLETNLKLYQAQEAEASALRLNKAKLQQEADFAKKQREEALIDPETQIQNTIDEFTKLGITAQGTTASKVAEFKASGKTLPEYIKGLREQFMSKPEYKKVLAKKAGEGISYETIGDFVYRKNADGTITKTNISAKKSPEAKTPVWKQDASGNWYNENSPTRPDLQTGGTTTGGVKATGNIVPVDVGNKTIRLDESGATGFSSAIEALKAAGIPITVGEGARNQAATIKSMADRYGIEYNSSNPADTAAKLRAAGHQVADPGKSNHETGMAIDVYGDGKLGKVSTAQEQILNANGWYSAGIPGDAGHFEYRGSGKGASTINANLLPLYRKYSEDNILPTKDQLKGLGVTVEQFTENASNGYGAYLASKAKEINQTYPTLNVEFNPASYGSLSATQREKLNESMTKIGDIDQRIENLKKLFKENGTEVWPTKAKSEMETLRKQIILKAKEVENLGVLNGPDLGILEDLLPSTTGITSGLFSLDENTMSKLDSVQSGYRSDAKTKGINYGTKISFKGESTGKPSTAPNVAYQPGDENDILAEWGNF